MLKECLASVFRETSDLSLEVIVVDNASNDDSMQIVTAAYPQIHWLQMDYNSGFARANNAGIRASKGDTVLLLNSDTIILNRAVSGCYERLANSEYIAAGVQLLNSDNSPQISGNFFMPGSLNNLLPLPVTGGVIKMLGTVLKVQKPHVPDAVDEQEVDWINGAFLMVKKDAIVKAALMDEDFFLYAEEAEWCYRLKKVGKLSIFGQFKVIHLQGETSNTAFGSAGTGYYNLYDRKGLQIMLSNFVRIRKQNGIGWFLFHLAVYTLNIPVHLIFAIVKSLFTFSMHELHRVMHFTRNMGKVWSLAPKIISNKPYFYKIL